MKKIIIMLLLLNSIMLNAKDITVYTYHNHAPFIIGKKQGLSYDLVSFLNKNSNNKFNFKLKIIPRSRLNYNLKPWINGKCEDNKNCDNNWILPWVNPKWGFGKNSLTNFSWFKLFEDSNSIIYLKENKINYENPNSLIGKRLAGIAGHKYLGIDELVKQGKITRIDGNNEQANLLKVLKKRVDVTLLPTSTFKYYLNSYKNLSPLEEATTKHQIYLRQIMTTTKNKELLNYLSSLDFTNIVDKYEKY